MKTLITGAAQPVSNFSERVRNLSQTSAPPRPAPPSGKLSRTWGTARSAPHNANAAAVKKESDA